LPLPTTLWVHGYVTVDGQKIGKSRGNAVEPARFTERFGVDGLRYFLLRHVGAKQDADIDAGRVEAVYRSELADDLGNLLARTTALLRRHPLSAGNPPSGLDPSGEALAARARELQSEVDVAMDRFAPDDALRAIWGVISATNRHLADAAPWALAKDPTRADSVEAILAHTASALRAIARALVPFLPTTAKAIEAALADTAVSLPVLFPKWERA
jgi:methionyl-tRNA synthetase